MSGDESFAKKLQEIELANYWNHDQKGNEKIKQPIPPKIYKKNDKHKPAQANNQVPAPAAISKELLTIKKFGDWNFRFNIVDGLLVFFYGIGGLLIMFSLLAMPIFFCFVIRRYSLLFLTFQLIYVLVAMICWTTFAAVLRYNIAFAIAACIIIGLELLYWIFLWKYAMLLSTLNSSERAKLLKYIEDSKN
ncbi:unnamed protein product [Blepharisma stoltei]|uniref:Vesicle transport protein n=1 Tax=Blepharisma stoltei TaxID=1481888 RepID=A0AAU9ISL1_9CILI|nr:unnamed protein product [Blepharisma stoltei]